MSEVSNSGFRMLYGDEECFVVLEKRRYDMGTRYCDMDNASCSSPQAHLGSWHRAVSPCDRSDVEDVLCCVRLQGVLRCVTL